MRGVLSDVSYYSLVIALRLAGTPPSLPDGAATVFQVRPVKPQLIFNRPKGLAFAPAWRPFAYRC
ncbi:hypothetical protein GCM10027034_40380 [Ramlibacter solisilvae]